MPYFLQNASFLPTFLRRVPKGFFSTTSSLEESSLDDDEDDDAFAAVDAGAAASSVLAYLVARSSMSLVCLCVVRSSTARRVDSVPWEGRKDAGRAPLEEAVLDVLLRRDGVAAGDRREACERGGAVSRARRRARGRELSGAQPSVRRAAGRADEERGRAGQLVWL